MIISQHHHKVYGTPYQKLLLSIIQTPMSPLSLETKQSNKQFSGFNSSGSIPDLKIFFGNQFTQGVGIGKNAMECEFSPGFCTSKV